MNLSCGGELICKLFDNKVMTKDLDAFRNRYNEDRDFSGDYAPAIPD